MTRFAALLYALLAPSAAGLFVTLALVTETLATGYGLAGSALAGAGAAWPVSARLARAVGRHDDA